jgi:hypothetical protein
VAGRLGSLRRTSGPRRIVLALVAAAVLAGAVFQLGLRDSTVAPRVALPTATATIGEGEDAIPVGPDGAILAWLPLPAEIQLPRLPISEPPPKGELGGKVLEQAQILGAAPPVLRPYMERSFYGQSGVDVELRAGIELRFGDATQLDLKWDAAAAVLADPEVTALDYVNLHAPRRVTLGGSGHTLPDIP